MIESRFNIYLNRDALRKSKATDKLKFFNILGNLDGWSRLINSYIEFLKNVLLLKTKSKSMLFLPIFHIVDKCLPVVEENWIYFHE